MQPSAISLNRRHCLGILGNRAASADIEMFEGKRDWTMRVCAEIAFLSAYIGNKVSIFYGEPRLDYGEVRRHLQFQMELPQVN